jgi:hypothetical protein
MEDSFSRGLAGLGKLLIQLAEARRLAGDV